MQKYRLQNEDRLGCANMPRTKADQRNHRFNKVIVLIWGNMEAKDIDMDKFSCAVGINKATLYRRKKKPENFSLDELSRIGRYLGIPIEELRQYSILY